MTFAQHQCSKLMSRDVGLIGLLRYLPLVQFTKARPVDSLGPFSLASLETGFFMATRLPATHGCTALSGPRICVCNYSHNSITWRAESRTHLSKKTRPST